MFNAAKFDGSVSNTKWLVVGNNMQYSGGLTIKLSRMWANAQRDGRPDEHRWRPLFNAAKFGGRPPLECRAITLPRRETR